jgi:outer membrane protein assembly factor BamB
VNNLLIILLAFFFISNCSFNKNSKFWTPTETIQKEKKQKEKIFVKEKNLDMEFNRGLKISLYSKLINNSFLNNFDNNNGRINYDGELKNISKFKFSKIDNFDQYDLTLSFEKNNIIFFNNKGTILKFNNNSKLLWEKNYYSKKEKKQKPILLFANNQNILIVADNIAKYYAIDIKSGKLLWSKKNMAPFNSQIKIYKDMFFIVDYENTLRSYSIKDGSEIWKIKTANTLVRTQKKLSMVIVSGKIYFNNSLGDISSVDIKSGELIWQKPTLSDLVFDESIFLKTSDLIADKNSLYFSNNRNEFFSIDINSGSVNWKQKVNSNLRSTQIDNYIFTVSLEGYLIVIEKNSGNIIRSTNLFGELNKGSKISFLSDKRMNPLYLFDKKNLNDDEISHKFKPTGFIVGKNNIYLSTDHGKLFIIDIATGTTQSILKIDNSKISRPSVLNQNLYIIKENSIIKLN